MTARTVSGSLPFGVEIDGVTHTAFELRAATLGDNIDAIDAAGDGGNNLKLSVEIMARQLTKLGTLPQAKITADLLRGACIEDWNALDQAAMALSKKSVPPKSG